MLHADGKHSNDGEMDLWLHYSSFEEAQRWRRDRGSVWYVVLKDVCWPAVFAVTDVLNLVVPFLRLIRPLVLRRSLVWCLDHWVRLLPSICWFP